MTEEKQPTGFAADMRAYDQLYREGFQHGRESVERKLSSFQGEVFADLVKWNRLARSHLTGWQPESRHVVDTGMKFYGEWTDPTPLTLDTLRAELGEPKYQNENPFGICVSLRDGHVDVSDIAVRTLGQLRRLLSVIRENETRSEASGDTDA